MMEIGSNIYGRSGRLFVGDREFAIGEWTMNMKFYVGQTKNAEVEFALCDRAPPSLINREDIRVQLSLGVGSWYMFDAVCIMEQGYPCSVTYTLGNQSPVVCARFPKGGSVETYEFGTNTHTQSELDNDIIDRGAMIDELLETNVKARRQVGEYELACYRQGWAIYRDDKVLGVSGYYWEHAGGELDSEDVRFFATAEEAEAQIVLIESETLIAQGKEIKTPLLDRMVIGPASKIISWLVSTPSNDPAVRPEHAGQKDAPAQPSKWGPAILPLPPALPRHDVRRHAGAAGLTFEEACRHLTAVMQRFGMTTEEAISVMDALIETGREPTIEAIEESMFGPRNYEQKLAIDDAARKLINDKIDATKRRREEASE